MQQWSTFKDFKSGPYQPRTDDIDPVWLDWLVVPFTRTRTSKQEIQEVFEALLEEMDDYSGGFEVVRLERTHLDWMEIILVQPDTGAAMCARHQMTVYETWGIIEDDGVREMLATWFWDTWAGEWRTFADGLIEKFSLSDEVVHMLHHGRWMEEGEDVLCELYRDLCDHEEVVHMDDDYFQVTLRIPYAIRVCTDAHIQGLIEALRFYEPDEGDSDDSEPYAANESEEALHDQRVAA